MKTSRAKLCGVCFMAQAKNSGGRSTGNTTGGHKKKRAGRRSGTKRSAKTALVVKKKWVDLILARKKDWELRGTSTAKRGCVHLAESGCGGTLVGRVRVVNCIPVPRSSLLKHVHHHGVSELSEVPYKNIFAWVLKDAERCKEPLTYQHSVGAVVWVKV